MTHTIRRTASIITALALLALLTWMAFRPAAVIVETAIVDTGIVEMVITEEGRTYVHERYVVSSPITAYRPRMRWHVGDRIRAGELIVALQPSRSSVLDPRSRAEAEASAARAESALAAARTNAQAAEARVDYAEKEHARLRDLFESGTISRQQLDTAEYELRDARAHLASARFAINVAEHELEAARTRLGYATGGEDGKGEQVEIRAATDGVVLAVPRESEAAIQVGEPIIEIGNPDTMEIHVDMLTTEAVKLTPGTPARLVRWGGDMTLQGSVRLVEPVGFTRISALGVEEQRARVIVQIDSSREDWRALGDGYRVEAEFIVARREGVVRVPGSALFRKDGNWMVFAVRDDHAWLQPVTTGLRSETHVVVESGLQAGDEVVSYPGSELGDGMRITRFNTP